MDAPCRQAARRRKVGGSARVTGMAEPTRTHLSLGSALVALQFALFGALALAAVLAGAGRAVPMQAWALALAGVALGAWAVACNRPGNFNIRPEPRAGGQLIVRGPYRWIRHPMYTAVVALAAACAAVIGATAGWLAVAALAAVLVAKAHVEERALLIVHPGYAAYRAGTKRFLPGIV